jgi:hypothetical protein
LGVVEDEDEGGGIEIGQVFFEDEQVGAALEAWAFAEFGQEDFEDAGGGKRSLGDEQGQKAFWLQGGHPVFEHGAFARAWGPGQEHDAAEGGSGVHEGEDFAVGRADEDLTGFFLGGKGGTAQTPGAQKVIERGRRFGSGRISVHSFGPGGGFGC